MYAYESYLLICFHHVCISLHVSTVYYYRCRVRARSMHIILGLLSYFIPSTNGRCLGNMIRVCVSQTPLVSLVFRVTAVCTPIFRQQATWREDAQLRSRRLQAAPQILVGSRQ